MENYHSRSGITISLPPFDATTDQLYLSIKSLVNQKFISLTRRLDKIENRQDEVIQRLTSLQETMLQVLEQNSQLYHHHTKLSSNKDDYSCMEEEYGNSPLAVDDNNQTSSPVTFVSETAQKNLSEQDGNLSAEAVPATCSTSSSTDNNRDISIVKCESISPSNHSHKGQPVHVVPVSTGTTKLAITNVNSRLEPRVVFDPNCSQRIFIGGQEEFTLPLWCYIRCLELVRSNTVECGPRLCLLLLQALFGRNYMLNHNYNGTFGKQPISKPTLNAILNQAKMQFGSDFFFTNALAYSKFRDYINNAFRVVAFQMRRGKRSILPFWNSNGEPMKCLEPPSNHRLNIGTVSGPSENGPRQSKIAKLDWNCVPRLTPANNLRRQDNEDTNGSRTEERNKGVTEVIHIDSDK